MGEGTEKGQVPGRPAEVKMSEGLELSFLIGFANFM